MRAWLGSLPLRSFRESARRFREVPRKGSPFRCGSLAAIAAGADSGANLSTALGKEEGVRAVQTVEAEEVNKRRAATTLHSLAVV